jgi:seryl-tRNA synthetase
MVREEVLYVSGELPKFADNLYRDHEDDKWMVPTAEVTLTGLHIGDTFSQKRSCRGDILLTHPASVARKMSAGRDVRGIKRGHQFDKVEMYAYCRPEDTPA